MDSGFDIPKPPGELSIPALLFFEHQAGRLPTSDYHVQTSVWVSENLSEYSPRPYTPLPMVLKTYCQDRNSGRTSYDRFLAAKISEWVTLAVRLKEQNLGDFQLLRWSREKLVSGNLPRHLESIDLQLSRFIRNKIPEEDFRIALRTKELDSRERTL